MLNGQKAESRSAFRFVFIRFFSLENQNHLYNAAKQKQYAEKN
jgi:hypothetical protein